MSDVKILEAVQAQADAIAQELVDHAFKHGKLVNAYLPEFIARAILAERERSAKAAKKAALELRGWPVSEEQAEVIAAAIRSPHE